MDVTNLESGTLHDRRSHRTVRSVLVVAVVTNEQPEESIGLTNPIKYCSNKMLKLYATSCCKKVNI